MKNVYLLVFLITVIKLSAQPVLSSNNIISNSSYYGIKIDPSNLTTEINKVGINQDWHFELMPIFQPTTIDTIEVLNAASTPFADSFPTATNAIHTRTLGQDDYDYYQVSAIPSQIEWLGMHNIDPANVVCGNTQLLFQFPFGYAVSNTDNYNLNYYAAGSSVSLLQQTGNIASHNGGYGNLHLPGNVILTDAVVISTTYNSTSTFSGGTSTDGLSTIEWYSPSYSRCLLKYTQKTTNGFFDYENLFYFTPTVPASVGINEIGNRTNAISLYPNPNNGNFTVRLNDNAAHTLEIYNTMGELLSKFDTVIGQKQIDLNSLTEGVYMLSVTTNNQKQQLRFIVTK